MTGTVFLISPEAPEPAAGAASEVAERASAKPRTLRLGVLDNGKGNADHLLRFIADELQKLFPIASVAWLRKTSMSHPSQPEIYNRLVDETDFVVSAIAD